MIKLYIYKIYKRVICKILGIITDFVWLCKNCPKFCELLCKRNLCRFAIEILGTALHFQASFKSAVSTAAFEYLTSKTYKWLEGQPVSKQFK